MWSIISKALINDLHWTSIQASLPYTIFTVTFVVAMVLFGGVQDTKGPKIVVTIGSLLMGSGIILSGIFVTPKMLVLTMGIITGTGVGMITVASSPAAVKWFPKNLKGLITGIVVAGAGLSGAFYSVIVSYFIANKGINKTFIIMGFIALIIPTIVAQWISNPPRGYGYDSLAGIKKNSKDSTWQEMLRSLNFCKLWIIFAFASSTGLMIIAHISTIAHIQTGWETGFILVIFLAVFNTLGRLFGGLISDKIGRINLIRLSLGLQFFNMLMFESNVTKIGLLVGVAVTGFCYGTNFSVFPAIISDLYGMKNFGINYGLIFTGWGFGGIIGPMIAANIYDRVGNFNNSYKLAAALLIISLFITVRIKEN